MEHSLEWSATEVWRRKLLYPAHTLPTAFAPVAVAAGLAAHDGTLDLAAAFVAFLAGWLIQVGGMLTDNYENLLREPKDPEHPELVRALARGTLTLEGLRGAIFAAYGIALLAGLYLVAHAGPGVLVIGAASIVASVAYSAGPFPLGRHTLADPLFFAFFGIVSVAGAYYVQAAPLLPGDASAWLLPHALPPAALALGIPVGALTTAILVVDDIRDRQFDLVKGKVTVAVRWGIEASRAEFVALQAVAYLAPPALWFVGYGAWVLLPLATLPYAIFTALDVLSLDRYEDLLPTTPKAGRVLLAYCVLLAIGLALAA